MSKDKEYADSIRRRLGRIPLLTGETTTGHAAHLHTLKPFRQTDISKYFTIETDKSPYELIIGLRPDNFFVAWKTGLTVEEFLQVASSLIDELKNKDIPPRPEVFGNPASKTIESGQTISIPPSYSGFGVNILSMDSKHLDVDDLPFSELEWSLNIDNIAQVAERKGGQVLYDNPDENFVRIDADPCSILFNGDRWPRSFSYWSHIYPPEELLHVYAQTHKDELAPEFFHKALETVITPYIGTNYFQI